MDDSSLSEKGCYKLFGPELRKWVLLALGVRFILMPICGHYDILVAYGYAAKLISGSISWYQMDADQPAYLFHVVALKAIQPFVKTFILSASAIRVDENSWGFWRAYAATPEVFRAFALFKLPYLAFDLLSAGLLLRILGRNPRAPAAVKFWLFNPLVLYVTYMFGRFDVIAIFFLLASIYALKNRKVDLAGLLFGICVALRFYYVIFLPAYAVISSERWTDRIRLLLFALLPLLFQISTLSAGLFPVGFPLLTLVLVLLLYPRRLERYGVPVLVISFLIAGGLAISNNGSIATAVGRSGFGLIELPNHATYPFKAKLPLWNYDTIYPVFILYGLFLFGALTVKRWRVRTFVALLAIFLLLYHSFSFWHPQYLLTVVVAVTLAYAWEKRLGKLHLIQCGLVYLIIFNWGAHPTNYLFAPLSPSAIFSSKALTVWLEELMGPLAPTALIGVSKGLFIATSLWMIWQLRKLVPGFEGPPGQQPHSAVAEETE